MSSRTTAPSGAPCREERLRRFLGRRFSLPAAAILLVALVACASSGSSSTGSSPTVLTRSEIEAVDVSTLYEVVQRLRPRWLNVRGDRSFGATTTIAVFQGQTYLGDAEILRDWGRESAESMRYLDGPRASTTLTGLGDQAVAGAIILEVRGR